MPTAFIFAFLLHKWQLYREEYLLGSAGTVWSEGAYDEDRAVRHRLAGSQAVRGAAEGWSLAWKAETMLSLSDFAQNQMYMCWLHKMTLPLWLALFKKKKGNLTDISSKDYLYLIFCMIHFSTNNYIKNLKWKIKITRHRSNKNRIRCKIETK